MDNGKIVERIHGQVATYLSDFAGQSAPHKDVLSGEDRDKSVLHASMDKIHSGECNVHDLARAYKNSPHSPPAALFKYIAHRVNNVDSYDSSHKAHQLDHSFMACIGSGRAKIHNHTLTPRHLNEWILTNPGLIEETLAHRDVLANLMHKSGANIRKINGEHHIALTRGLDTPLMQEEMPLASFADEGHSGFGTYQHHVWMPLKDLWYGFPISPYSSRGAFGHENEWVMSNSAQRYAARAQDVKRSHFSSTSGHLDPELVALGGLEDDASAALIASGRLPPIHATYLHELGLLGHKTLAAVTSIAGKVPSLANHPAVPREEALAQALEIHQDKPVEDNAHAFLAMTNPNLTAQDLETIITSPDFPITHSMTLHRSIVGIAAHPSFNESVGSALVERILGSPQKSVPQYFLPLIAKNAKTPCLALHRALITALDTAENCPWSAAAAIGACFNPETAGSMARTAPQAFNNTKNAERYLRALSDYFGKNSETETPHNIYHCLLSGARLDDTTINVLVDLATAERPLTGTTIQEHRELLAEMARWNPYLSARHLVILSDIPECAESLLFRNTLLPSTVQANIAAAANPEVASILAHRDDLSPEAADVLLKRFAALPDAPQFAMTSVVSNPRIPMSLIEKHVHHESTAKFANAIAAGLRERSKRAVGFELPEPPIGGME